MIFLGVYVFSALVFKYSDQYNRLLQRILIIKSILFAPFRYCVVIAFTMKFYPLDTPSFVEFDKIVDLLQRECFGEPAKNYFAKMEVLTRANPIRKLLDQTAELKKTIEDSEPIPIHHYESIAKEVVLLRKEGYVLPIESIQSIHNVIKMGLAIDYYFKDFKRQRTYTELYEICGSIDIHPSLSAEIDRVLDDEGNVKPNASEELQRISSRINQKERELDSTFKKISDAAKKSGYLSDTIESLRNGRRVLTVSAEHKRKIGGVIHDESATGKTVFLEPTEVQMVNNEIVNLYADRRKEIYKILSVLCSQLRPYADSLLEIQSVVIALDVIHAKARLAIILEADKPKIVSKPSFGYKMAYNPILYIKNKKLGLPTIPFDLTLHGPNRLLVLSGPNAGGKSVTLKTVGILQIMVQCGMLIPCDPNSEVGIYDSLYTDIGDQQSMEDDLSTYSSRLTNMKYFLENANDKSLILIDEFGSGTDPNVGGAIAEAILRSLNYNKVHGVITTHYSNLKYYAFKTKGILNGSMEFDTESIRPTYHLIVGKPGNSFAYEIAEKIGLDNRVIKYAKNKTGKNEKAIDDLLIKLQEEKKSLESRLSVMEQKESKVDRLMKTYNELHKELEFRRKKIKLSAKEQSLFQLGQDNKELDAVIKQLKASKDMVEAKKVAANYKSKREKIKGELSQLKEEVYYQDKFDVTTLAEGDFVKMRTGNSTGQILSIRKNKAEVQMGIMKMMVPLKELLPAKEPISINDSRRIVMDTIDSGQAFDRKLDVRGYTRSDTLEAVQEFMDRALLANANSLTIVHGVGSGALRKAVLSKLKEYSDIKEISHPDDNYGGKGVTYITL